MCSLEGNGAIFFFAAGACHGGWLRQGRHGWSSLPADLLLAVFALLPSDADRVHFRAVCVAWAAAAWRPRA